MKPRPFPVRLSTQGHLLALVAAVLVPLLAFAALLLYRYAEAERARYERDAVQIARQSALAVDGELAGLLSLLRGLSASSALAGRDWQGFHREASRLVRGSDAIVLLREAGPRQLVDTARPFGEALPPAITLGPGEEAALGQGRPVVSGVYGSPISGEPRIAVALPVGGPGAPLVLAVTVPTARLHHALLPAVPEGWVVGVGDRDGTYVTRSQRHEEVSGTPGLPDYLSRAVGRSGTFTAPGLDGQPLLAGYHRSDLSGWLFGANIPRRTVEAPLWRSLGTLVVLGGAALALSALMAWLFGTTFAAAAEGLAARATALGQGRPVPPLPTRLSEFAVVGEALAAAAAAIEERARERERSIEREALLGSVFETAGLQVGIVEHLGDDCRFVAANRGAAAALGRSEGIEGLGARDLGLGPVGIGFWLDLFRICETAGGPVTVEHRFGDGHWHLGTFTLLPPGASGRPRMAFTSIDIEDRRRAEQALSARTRELEIVLATVPAGVWFTYDPQARHVVRNRFADALMRIDGADGDPAALARGLPGHLRILKEGRPLGADELPLVRAMRGERIDDEEYAFAFADGTVSTLLASAAALRDEEGAVVGAVAVALDISERKRGEEQRRLLLHELNHRVKNTLATVQSIALQTLRDAASAADAQAALTDRLIALSKAHDVLTRESWEGAELHEIVEGAAGAHAGAGRVTVEGPRVWLSPGVSLSLALALHELATNAAKYGALSAAGGSVRIAWELARGPDGTRLLLRWVERGGPRVEPPTRQGFGTRLIRRSLSAETGGSVNIDYEPEGVVCTLELPLDGDRLRAGRPSAG